MNEDQGTLEVAAGQSRSGKTWLTAQRLKGEKNLLVWDAVGEFADKFKCVKVTDPAVLVEIAASGRSGRFAFNAQITRENFDLFCRSAWLWIRVHAHHGRRVALCVEELADVTPPGKAPTAWGEIIRKSLRFNPYIVAMTQSPAESDKTVMRNSTILRCHSVNTPDDRKTLAKYLDVDESVVASLDFNKKQFIERDKRAGTVVKGGKGAKPKPLQL